MEEKSTSCLCDSSNRERSKGVPPTWIVICGAVIVQVGFGIYPVVVRKFGTEEDVNPYTFTFYRDACAFPVLVVCSLALERKLIFPHLKMVPLFMLMGFCGMFAGQFLYITGVYNVGANVASIFQPLIPVWTTVISIVTCIESVGSLRMSRTWAKFLGIILAVGGAVEIIMTGGSLTAEDGDSEEEVSSTTLFNSSLSDNSTSNSTGLTDSPPPLSQALIGYLALIVETPMAGIYVLLQKKFIFNSATSKWKNYPIAITATCYFFGALYMGLASTYYLFTDQTEEFRMPPYSYIALVYAIFITSALCYGLITWTNKHLPSSIATAFWPLQVLVTVLVSFAVTGEQLYPWQYLGAAMLICGLLCVLYSKYKDEQVELEGEGTTTDCCDRISGYVNARRTEGKKGQSLPLLSSPLGRSTTDSIANGDNVTARQSETPMD